LCRIPRAFLGDCDKKGEKKADAPDGFYLSYGARVR